MRRIIFIIAFGLIAAACGSGETGSTFESLDSGSSADPMPSTTATTQPPSTTDAGDTSTTTETAPGTTAPTAIPDSDYPDVVVADLAGGEFNLKELVLEEEPVLLWFWAPH